MRFLPEEKNSEKKRGIPSGIFVAVNTVKSFIKLSAFAYSKPFAFLKLERAPTWDVPGLFPNTPLDSSQPENLVEREISAPTV